MVYQVSVHNTRSDSGGSGTCGYWGDNEVFSKGSSYGTQEEKPSKDSGSLRAAGGVEISKVIIPARGGSKRIPKKNLIDFCGKPLVAWSIIQGLAFSPYVYVSTDDEEIAQVSTEYGANTIKRPEEFSTDHATLEDVLNHTASYLSLADNEVMVVLQPTSPLRLPTDIQKAVSGLDRFSSIISCNMEDDLFLWQSGIPVTFSRVGRVKSSDYVRENGNIYVTTPKTLEWNRYGWNPGFFIQEKWQGFEIDKHEDIEICEYFMERYVKSL